MTAPPDRCVVDASVLVKLFVEEEHSDLAQSLLHSLLAKDDDAVFVPDLAFIECANILWKKVRRSELPLADAEEHLADLAALSLPTTPTSTLMARALILGCSHGITAYDACYLALAEDLGIALLTADDKLAAALSSTTHAVVQLASLAS